MSLDFGTGEIIVGDCREALAGMAAGSCHACITSPPYWGLRRYLDEDHPSKAQELGNEPTLEEYLAHIVEVFREVKRVLRDDGVLFLNCGDAFAGSGKGWRPGSGRTDGIVDERAQRNRNGTPTPSGLKPKDLIGLPWRVAFALQQDGWFLRQETPWYKLAPMPGSQTDRSTSAHEWLFQFTKSGRCYYDGQAVKRRGSSGPSDVRKMAEQLPRIGGKHKQLEDPLAAASAATHIGVTRGVGDPAGRNLRTTDLSRDVAREQVAFWTAALKALEKGGVVTDEGGELLSITTGGGGTGLAHYASYPVALVWPCVLAGTSEVGCCPSCGAQFERVVERSVNTSGKGRANIGGGFEHGWEGTPPATLTVNTVGWQPGCTCNAGPPIPATVLDPFAGIGTTGLVAQELGRHFVLIELSEEYAQMAAVRIRAGGNGKLMEEYQGAERTKQGALEL